MMAKVDDQTLLSDFLTPTTGMKSLHLLRVGAPVDLERVIEEYVPLQSRWGWTKHEWTEGDVIKRHHLTLIYPKRGPVQAKMGDGLVNAVLWMLQPEERMSVGIQDAADTYWAAFDVVPASAFAHKLPANAPVELKLAGCCEGKVLRLSTKETVPKSGVLVL